MTEMVGKKILLIDDDPMVIRSIEKALELKGFDVTAVSSGREGIEQAAGASFDLVISDVRMPGMDGIEAMEKIQQTYRAQGKHCSYMFITGYAEDERAQKAAALGIAEFLMKPFDLSHFLESVERELALGQSKRDSSEKSSEVIPENSNVGVWKHLYDRFIYVKPVLLKQTNLLGSTYFADYVEWQGETRESCLLSHPSFAVWAPVNQHIKMITHSLSHQFIRETTFGDVVRVEMTSREIKLCSLIMKFNYFSHSDNILLGQGWQKICFVNLHTNKLCPIPRLILDLAEPIEEKV